MKAVVRSKLVKGPTVNTRSSSDPKQLSGFSCQEESAAGIIPIPDTSISQPRYRNLDIATSI